MYALTDEAVDEVHRLALKMQVEADPDDYGKLTTWINRVAAERYPVSRYDTSN